MAKVLKLKRGEYLNVRPVHHYSRVRDHFPDPLWNFTDARGHEHSWTYLDSKPTVQSARWVEDKQDECYSEAGLNPYKASGHLECVQCGARVEPEYLDDSSNILRAADWIAEGQLRRPIKVLDTFAVGASDGPTGVVFVVNEVRERNEHWYFIAISDNEI